MQLGDRKLKRPYGGNKKRTENEWAAPRQAGPVLQRIPSPHSLVATHCALSVGHAVHRRRGRPPPRRRRPLEGRRRDNGRTPAPYPGVPAEDLVDEGKKPAPRGHSRWGWSGGTPSCRSAAPWRAWMWKKASATAGRINQFLSSQRRSLSSYKGNLILIYLVLVVVAGQLCHYLNFLVARSSILDLAFWKLILEDHHPQ
jgi:hypothetical protein